MPSALSLYLPKRMKSFAFNYAPNYQTLITNHIMDDPAHPLYIARTRIHNERPRAGLWWHATVASTSSKSAVIRTWMRRRLRNAFIDELKARGIAEDGKILKDVKRSFTSSVIEGLAKREQDTSLKGSLKLHAMAPMLTAKYTLVRKETGVIIDALLMGLDADLNGVTARRPTRKTDGRPRSQLQQDRSPRNFIRLHPRSGKNVSAASD
jgi:hypothetical protein